MSPHERPSRKCPHPRHLPIAAAHLPHQLSKVTDPHSHPRVNQESPFCPILLPSQQLVTASTFFSHPFLARPPCSLLSTSRTCTSLASTLGLLRTSPSSSRGPVGTGLPWAPCGASLHLFSLCSLSSAFPLSPLLPLISSLPLFERSGLPRGLSPPQIISRF